VNLPFGTFPAPPLDPGSVVGISGLSVQGENLESWESGWVVRWSVFQVSSFSVSHPAEIAEILAPSTRRRHLTTTLRQPECLALLPALDRSGPFPAPASRNP